MLIEFKSTTDCVQVSIFNGEVLFGLVGFGALIGGLDAFLGGWRFVTLHFHLRNFH